MPPAMMRRAPAAATARVGAGQVPADAMQGGPYASAFQDATNASTAMAREDFQQDLGGAIGGLNAIGALRSGRASTTLNDASRTFGRQVGNIAASNAGQLASLNSARAEGEANRGVTREGMAMQDRQFGQRLSFDSTNADREFGYRGARDAVGDARDTRNYDRGVTESDRTFGRQTMESDREFGYRGGRDSVNDARYADETTYGRGRDANADARDDRNFGYTKERDAAGDARDDRDFGYRKSRDANADTRDDRNFGYTKERDIAGDARDTRNFNQGVKESDRSFGEGQRQFNVGTDAQRTAARQAGQGQIWSGALQAAGKISQVAGVGKGIMSGASKGAAIGSIVPGVGTAIGGVVGGAIGGLKKLFKW